MDPLGLHFHASRRVTSANGRCRRLAQTVRTYQCPRYRTTPASSCIGPKFGGTTRDGQCRASVFRPTRTNLTHTKRLQTLQFSIQHDPFSVLGSITECSRCGELGAGSLRLAPGAPRRFAVRRGESDQDIQLVALIRSRSSPSCRTTGPRRQVSNTASASPKRESR